MPLKAKTRQENSAGGPKGLVAGLAAAEQWRWWWWWHTAPTNKHPKPVRVIRLPALRVMMSKATRRQFNCPWRGKGTSSHCVFMFVQCWQWVEPGPVRAQTRLLKYMNKKLNKWKKAKSAENTYKLWCWCWAH